MTTTTAFMVYHHVTGNFLADKAQASNMSQNYHQVATVKVDSIDKVFELTNHIHGDWRENPGVIWSAFYGPPRSTSVGDVVRNCTTEEWFMCMPCGWEKV